MPMNVKPVPDPRRAHQRHPHAHRGDRQRGDPPQRDASSGGDGADGRRPTPSARSRRSCATHVKERVKQDGLWAPHLPQEYGGMGLDFLAHAYMNEVLAYARRRRRRCSASSPPTRATRRSSSSTAPRSRSRSGCCPSSTATMESGFSMTEPRERRLRPPLARPRAPCATATSGSSTATSGSRRTASPPTSSSSCAGSQDDTGQFRPGPDGADHRADRHARASTSCGASACGARRRPTTARCSTRTCASRSRTSSGAVGEGHRAAQDRLGAGRIFHCMNSVGQMWRAFDLMVERAITPRGARRPAEGQAVHPGLHRRQLHGHPRPPG